MRQRSLTEVILAAHVRYVRTRDGVFQYERRVPARVQRDTRRFSDAFDCKPLFRRSLHTKNEGDMFAAAQSVHDEFERLVSVQKSVEPMPRPAERTPNRVVTAEDLESVAMRHSEVTAGVFEALHRRANVDPDAAAELARLEYDLERDAEDIKQALRGQGINDDCLVLKPVDEARHIVAEAGFAAPEGTDEFAAIIGAVRAGMEQGYQRIGAMLSGGAIPQLPQAAPAKAKEVGLTLAEAVGLYLEARKPAQKTVAETKLALRQFEATVGRKALAAITRQDAHLYVQSLAKHKVGGKTAGSIVRPLSEQSIGKRLRMLASAIYHARDSGQFHGDNPLANVRLSNFVKPKDRAIMPDKRRLKVSELNAIFSHPWFTGCKSPTDTHTAGTHRLSGSEYWVPVVAVLTGCRASELGGLKLSEVRLDDAMPHFLIRSNEYRRTKNGRSRCVPILDLLIELGFPAYVDKVRKAGATRLFPDWKAIKPAGGGDEAYPAWSNARIIRAFNRTVIPATLGDQLSTDARREVTFHSLRGAFKAMIGTTNNLPMNVVHEVVGHAKSELDERYIGEVTIEETYPYLHSMKYKELFIPPAP